MIINLIKAATLVAVSPLALAVDVVTLPGSAYDGKHPFHRAKRVLNSAGEKVEAAIKEVEK